MPTLARSNWADVNWARALVFAALLVLAFALAEPAYAFSQFESTVTVPRQRLWHRFEVVMLISTES